MFTLNHRYGDTLLLPSDWLARIASTIARLWSRGRQELHARLTSMELQALDDRMLKDIGLQRCSIESAVLHACRGEWDSIARTHRTMPRSQLDGKAQHQ